MNRLTKFTFAAALNAICATIALGMAAVAIAAEVPCGTPVNASCLNTCDGYVAGPSFNCCNNYGTSCCRRLCNTVQCIQDLAGDPCNTQLQTASTSGATVLNTSCTVKGTCLP
jgi:hypothetical protein